MQQLPTTGERLLTKSQDKTMVEHLHRYSFATYYTANKKVLDIASGEGYGTNLLSKTAEFVYGVDISKDAVDYAAAKYAGPNIRYLHGSATGIPLPDKSVDVVVSFETIEHHDKHDEMMLECRRVLADDGVFVISSPDKKFYTDIPNYNNPYHVKELYKQEFADLLKKYFSYVHLYKQGITRGSIIYNDALNQPNKFDIATGSYEQLVKLDDIECPDYLLIVASNRPVEAHPNSFFESQAVNYNLYEEIRRYKESYEKIINSMPYKVGLAAEKPIYLLSKVKKLFSGRK